MSAHPLAVSVLLPVRDAAKHLEEAAASLEAQTFSDFEVLAIDDGSKDETPSILAEWARRDPRVRVERQPGRGIVAALERARSIARGTYLARMDGDDIAEPTRLEAQLNLMRDRPEIAACGCRVRYFPRQAVRDGARRYERWLNASIDPDEIARDMFVECPIAHPTLFVRAEAVDAVGGYRDVAWPEDYDLILRLWAAEGRFAKVPDALLHWREGAGRLSRTSERYGLEAFLACKLHFLRDTLLRGKTGAVIWGAGPVGKAASRALTEGGTRVEAFVEVDPRKIGQEIHGVPVLDASAGALAQGALHLAAVGQPGARGRLRALLTDAGLEELRDFVAIA